jgi:putative pyruvate formate lyase activating enzyme
MVDLGANLFPILQPDRFATPSEADRLRTKRAIASAEKNRGSLPYSMPRIDITGKRVALRDVSMELKPIIRELSPTRRQTARLEEIEERGSIDRIIRPASYVALEASGELSKRIEQLRAIREIDRFGVFKKAGGAPLRIGGYNLNIGEEREISGVHGSGVVYFGGCSMKCRFCWYADIAQLSAGKRVTPEALAEIFLELQARGAHNIHLMTPSHFVGEIVEALSIAAKSGLQIPLVYNTGGFEDLDALRALDGIVDIYLPDAKFGTDAAGKRYGGVDGYAKNNQAAIREMFRQVGNLALDDRGVAHRGVLVRHLVMPGNHASAERIAEFLASVSSDLHVSLMNQWTPDHLSFLTPEVNRPVTKSEYRGTLEIFRNAGLSNVRDQSRQSVGL